MKEMEDILFYCTSCGEELSEDEYFTFEDDYYCEDCLDERTFTCERCGERLSNDRNSGDDDTQVCGRCYDYHYTTCDRCNCIISTDDVRYDDDDDDRLCSSCYEDYSHNTCIYNYSYKPTPIFHGDDNRYMGVELEIDKGGKDSKHAKELCLLANRNGEHIYIKHDGSLTNGFEIVTHPMTLEYHAKEMPWKTLIERAVELNYLSHDTDTCGLHVHVNRDCFGDDPVTQDIGISKILYFIERFWSELLLFSRRTEAQLDRWAKRYGYEESPGYILSKAKQDRKGRYMCVNLENCDTFEFRIFRGTLIYNTLIATLQLVDEICDVASLMYDYELTCLTWDDFTRRIDLSKHPELVTYLKEKRLYSLSNASKNTEEE